MTDYFTAEQVYQSLKEENAALRKFCHEAQAENETLRMGYAAARLEIESLQARIKTMAEEHADELTVAHLDGRMRAEQPAGAQQPGAGTWTPLPGTLPEPGKPVLLDIGKEYPIRAMWAAKHTLEVGVEDDSGFGEYDEATGTYYCPEGWYEWNEHEEIHWAVNKTPTAWCELPPNGGASHGQAPAQAAPAPLQVPKGWSFAVSHSDGRVWLTISTPHGASATLSAAEKTGNGDDTIVAQVLGYLADSLAAPAAVAGPWSAGELDGNWLHIDHKDHAGVIRIVWKMEGDARNPVCEARAMAVIAALNAYAAPTTQPAHQQEAASVDLKTMELAESVGLIGPASRTNDLHAAIQRFHDLICANATIKAAAMAVEVISGVSAHQWDTGYPPLPKPNIQRGGFPNLFTEDQMRAYVDADRAARAPADSVTAPVGERENLALRRMLCVAHAGAAAYMDDGEAQDSRELPLIDFLRDTPAEIQDKLQKRMLNKPAAGAPTPPAQAADSVLEDAARLDWLDEDAGNHVTRVGKTWYTRPTYGHPYRKHKNLRAAIDAARAAQEGKSHGN